MTCRVRETLMPDFDQNFSPGFFPGFSELHVEAGGVAFCGVTGGFGPPMLLLHGYPQTHLAWRRIASRLAQSLTVVVPDLPGYGNSRTYSEHPRWTKRRVAESLIDLMSKLGHGRFGVVGHDRGARAGYRLVLGYPVGPAKFTQPPRPSDLSRSSSPAVPLSGLRPTWRAAQIVAQKGP